jgi:hypothetical protein
MLTLDNGGSLTTRAAPSHWPGTNISALIEVGGTLNLSQGSWIYPVSHPTNGGGALFRVGRLNIASNAGFNAQGRGYLASQRTSANGLSSWGYGPGRGYIYGGAGHGGMGKQHGGQGSLTYGSSNAPVEAGSGGGAEGYSGPGGNGGGLIRIESANSISVAGSINANGNTGSSHSGSGSGGSIYLRCTGLTGPAWGKVTANGGGSAGCSGGGGGGRIAIYCVNDVFAGTVSADGGPGNAGPGIIGTIFQEFLPTSGTLIMIR